MRFLPSAEHRFWFARGAARLFSVPSLILMGAFVGFAGLARDQGFSAAQTLFMVATIWALPAKVVLIGAVASNASVLTAALAVGLSSIRLMPMVVALMPEMRGPRTRPVTLYLLSHFVAVTAWVMALEAMPAIERRYRTAYFAGLVLALVTTNLAVTALTFQLADRLPPLAAAGLTFVTPLYFLFSLWRTAREPETHHAMLAGLALTPLFHLLFPGADILLTGLVGGTLAYGFGRLRRRRRA